MPILRPPNPALTCHNTTDIGITTTSALKGLCRRRHNPFHVVKWATDALDEERREAWNTARGAVGQRRAGRASGLAKDLKGARWALWKNPEDLTVNQSAQLEWIVKTNPRLYRAYLLKEGLRTVFKLPLKQATEALDRWLSWARRCRIPAFVKLAKSITNHRASILAAIEHGLSNGRIESVNTKIRLITRVAFGFKSPDALIALAMLNLGGHRPVLPGRPTKAGPQRPRRARAAKSGVRRRQPKE